jgi:hypothetical protein
LRLATGFPVRKMQVGDVVNQAGRLISYELVLRRDGSGFHL